jgi:hypothetical protein
MTITHFFARELQLYLGTAVRGGGEARGCLSHHSQQPQRRHRATTQQLQPPPSMKSTYPKRQRNKTQVYVPTAFSTPKMKGEGEGKKGRNQAGTLSATTAAAADVVTKSTAITDVYFKENKQFLYFTGGKWLARKDLGGDASELISDFKKAIGPQQWQARKQRVTEPEQPGEGLSAPSAVESSTAKTSSIKLSGGKPGRAQKNPPAVNVDKKETKRAKIVRSAPAVFPDFLSKLVEDSLTKDLKVLVSEPWIAHVNAVIKHRTASQSAAKAAVRKAIAEARAAGIIVTVNNHQIHYDVS